MVAINHKKMKTQQFQQPLPTMKRRHKNNQQSDIKNHHFHSDIFALNNCTTVKSCRDIRYYSSYRAFIGTTKYGK